MFFRFFRVLMLNILFIQENTAFVTALDPAQSMFNVHNTVCHLANKGSGFDSDYCH
jgi:hypothetical protein